jgi:hypothetical protein
MKSVDVKPEGEAAAAPLCCAVRRLKQDSEGAGQTCQRGRVNL